MDAPTNPIFFMLRDARQEAEEAMAQLQEVTELLGKEDYVRAIGAFGGLDERVLYVGIVLRRYARHLGIPR